MTVAVGTVESWIQLDLQTSLTKPKKLESYSLGVI